jgi:hypothetical protein
MDIVVPVSYYREETKKKCKWICKCITKITDYGVYYFGKDADLITNAKDFSIYRGTFRNLTSLSGASTSSFNASANPMQSKEDPTNLLYKNISASYDAFSTQVEANKGYNMLNAEKDIDEYERNKTYGDMDPKCIQRVL